MKAYVSCLLRMGSIQNSGLEQELEGRDFGMEQLSGPDER